MLSVTGTTLPEIKYMLSNLVFIRFDEDGMWRITFFFVATHSATVGSLVPIPVRGILKLKDGEKKKKYTTVQ